VLLSAARFNTVNAGGSPALFSDGDTANGSLNVSASVRASGLRKIKDKLGKKGKTKKDEANFDQCWNRSRSRSRLASNSQRGDLARRTAMTSSRPRRSSSGADRRCKTRSSPTRKFHPSNIAPWSTAEPKRSARQRQLHGRQRHQRTVLLQRGQDGFGDDSLPMPRATSSRFPLIGQPRGCSSLPVNITG
jgi:hypothetical protein